MMFEMHNAAAADLDEPEESNWLLAINNTEGLDTDALRKVFDNLELIKGPFVRFWSNLNEPPVGYIPVPGVRTHAQSSVIDIAAVANCRGLLLTNLSNSNDS
eukprot:GILK01020998.1.p2 GENE.GILK01020998.1~~GILK01020998.1.p2  ORF type:complete len:102 (-),score=22.46 GILK01020998.1:306-611(-)